MSDSAAITRHYGNDGIAGRVLEALRDAKGPDAPVTPESLAPFDHFHTRGVAGTEDVAARLAPRPGERLLDIGAGIGGPARWFAAKYGVEVTGVDLTPEFCAAARRSPDGAAARLGLSTTTESRCDAPGMPRRLACASVQSIVAAGASPSGPSASGGAISLMMNVGSHTCATAARLCARTDSAVVRSSTDGSAQSTSMRNG